MNCPFYTPQGSCEHVDRGVGELVVIDPLACEYCVKTIHKPEHRKEGKVVLHWIFGQRKKRGLPAVRPPRIIPTPVALRNYARRPTIADEMIAVAKTVPRSNPAPIVADPEDRLSICEDCDQWRRGKCTASCSCKKRPRPTALEGPDCPRHLWRRS